jgi:hypothetical protein
MSFLDQHCRNRCSEETLPSIYVCGLALMNDPPKDPRFPDDPVSCTRCGKPVTLLNVIARLGERPACRILGCTICFQLEWIWEAP